MGRNAKEWTALASLVTDAGADMVECNFSCPNMKDGSLGAVLGCGRCYIACRDGGYQAMEFEQRKVFVNGKKCVGCHLCSLVCPTGAIAKAKRVKQPDGKRRFATD